MLQNKKKRGVVIVIASHIRAHLCESVRYYFIKWFSTTLTCLGVYF